MVDFTVIVKVENPVAPDARVAGFTLKVKVGILDPDVAGPDMITALSVIGPVKPCTLVRVMVDVPVAVPDDGLGIGFGDSAVAETVKSGGARVTDRGKVWPAPVTVRETV